jgi:hypothetical protein
MLTLVPRHPFSWDFKVMQGPHVIAEIDNGWWRERADIAIGSDPYTVRRESVLRGEFVLEHGGTALARARKPSAFRRLFVVDAGTTHLVLRARSIFRRAFVLMEGDTQVGWISPDRFYSRRATANFPEGLPLPVNVFIAWLTVLLWRRQERRRN